MPWPRRTFYHVDDHILLALYYVSDRIDHVKAGSLIGSRKRQRHDLVTSRNLDVMFSITSNTLGWPWDLGGTSPPARLRAPEMLDCDTTTVVPTALKLPTVRQQQ